jgi:glucose/arabinose dehydrogenase
MMHRGVKLLSFVAAGLVTCGISGLARAQTTGEIATKQGMLRAERVARGLVHPWGMALLPDGRLLVSERPGRLRIVATDGTVSAPVQGTPEVLAQGQGGLLDVALAPDFAKSRAVYLSFAEPGDGGASTALGRGTLADGRIDDFRVVFRQQPKVEGANHFGGRIVFARDGTLFLTLGERFAFEPAQDLSSHLGKVVRVRLDGSVPDDNPFVGRGDARPEIWSYGHRNVESAALHPETAALWIAEMGPQGGDELNLPEAGKNHGWPRVSWGEHYDGRDIPDPPTEPRFADAVRHWTPVISPSGMLFYTGTRIPAWRGSVLIGGLSSRGLVRLTQNGASVTDEERIDLGARIRDVEQAPDGSVYVLTDERDGDVLRIGP